MSLLNGPTKDQMKNIIRELNEDEERFEHNVNLLKTWISYQDHLPRNYDVRLIPVFLRGCKHDLERAKRKLELYFTVKKTIPELYVNRDTTSAEFLSITKVMSVVPLPNLNTDGCRVCVIKIISPDTTLYQMEHVVRYIIMMGDLRVHEETPIAGDIFIVDGGNNMSATHVARAANSVVSKGMAIAHNVYPQRLKAIHIINIPEFAEKLLILFRSFMKEKMRNRFIVHRTPDTLIDHIAAEILPKEYGGNGGDLALMHKEWIKYLTEKDEWFKEQAKIVATGPVPKHLTHSCAFDANDEIQGSFRKLAID